MRILLIPILVLFLSVFQVNAQEISAELLVNNEQNINVLSRTRPNNITINGIGCDQFEISTICASAIKTDAGYIVTPSFSCNEVYISVMAIENGKRMLLFKQRFKIED